MKCSKYLLAFITLHFCYFLTLGLLHLWSFESSLVDIGSFEQILFLASQGVWPTTSINLPAYPNTPWLGFHFTPLVFLLTPLYWLYAGPEWLTVVHVFCVSITAWPIFCTCRRLGVTEAEAFCWSVVYLLNIVILYTAIWEFHEHSLALPLMATGLWALAARRVSILWWCVVGLMLTKEHYGLAAAGFGLAWGIRHHDYKTAIMMMLTGVIMFGSVNGIIMPLLNKGVFSMFEVVKPTMENYHLSRYAWLKWEPKEAAGYALMLLGSKVNIHFYITVMFSLLGVFLAGWVFLLPVAGELAANMLSDYFLPRMFTAYHNSTFIVAAVVAACAGSQVIAKKISIISSKEIAIALAVIQILIALIMIPPPPVTLVPQLTAHNFFYPKALRELQQLLPQEKAVMAGKNIGVYFAHRQTLFKFPYGANQADAVVLYLEKPLFNKAAWFGEEEGAEDTVPDRKIIPELERLLRDPAWGVTFWRDGWLLLEKGKPHKVSPEMVRKKWKTS